MTICPICGNEFSRWDDSDICADCRIINRLAQQIEDGPPGPETATSQLKPCPFCGAGVTDIREIRAPSVHMDGRRPMLISVEVRHHCAKGAGHLTRQNVTMAGRDHASAIAAWNRRAQP